MFEYGRIISFCIAKIKATQFTNALASITQKDGSDITDFFIRFFEVLNTPIDKRSANLSTWLAEFPYVNGGLFKDVISIPTFTQRSRAVLIECGELGWQDINPDIFGSMFQAVITPEHRGTHGQHYTSVPNIMKVLAPLFLNDLYDAFEQAKGNNKKLRALYARIGNIKIFDPACGSGNFLIIAYKELCRLEMKIIKELGWVA